jgi:hypothetical protein
MLSSRQAMALRQAVHRAAGAPARTMSPVGDTVINALGEVLRAGAVTPSPLPKR